MIKLFSTRVHGMLDYGVALLLLLVPRLLNLPGDVITLLTVLGLGVVVYSLITRYELSIAKILPMVAHLAIDALGGLLLLGAAVYYLINNADTAVWLTLLIFGLLELGAALMTDPVSPIEATATTATGAKGTTASTEQGGVRIYEDKR